jgi:hypothetical protein
MRHGSNRHQHAPRHTVSLLDHIKVGRLPERPTIGPLTLIPIQSPQPLLNLGVLVPDHSEITLEDGDIRNIKTYHCHVQPDVSFRDMVAEEVGRVPWLREVGFDAVECCEERVEVGLVSGLGRGEAGFVDARPWSASSHFKRDE